MVTSLGILKTLPSDTKQNRCLVPYTFIYKNTQYKMCILTAYICSIGCGENTMEVNGVHQLFG